MYYEVRPAKNPTGKLYPTSTMLGNTGDLWSGTLSIFFKAYKPFGCMTYTSYEEYDLDGAGKHCGILPSAEMPSAVEASVGNYLIYNPGTETCDTVIRIAGSAPNGITITNATTNDKCILHQLPTGSDYLEIDSDAGSIQQLPSYPDDYAFEYHDDGYIRLASYLPRYDNVIATHESGSNEITVSGVELNDGFVGKYIRLAGGWYRIIYVRDNKNAVVNQFLTDSGKDETMIVTMNEIIVEGDGAELTKLEIEYTPLVR